MKSTLTFGPDAPFALCTSPRPFTESTARLRQSWANGFVEVGHHRDEDLGGRDAEFGRLRCSACSPALTVPTTESPRRDGEAHTRG